MGFFSYTCAKTGLPVMADAGASTEDLVLCDATLVPRRGKCISGLYDGYGRLDGQEITEQVARGEALRQDASAGCAGGRQGSAAGMVG